MILDALFGARTDRLSSGWEQPIVDAFGGSPTSAGEKVTERSALGCSAVKAAVSLLAETVASLPVEYFRRLPGGGREEAFDTPQHELLNGSANPETSSFNFKETEQGHLGTWGNGYAEIQTNARGEPIALWQRSPRPQHTKPIRLPDGKLVYELHDEHGAFEGNVEPDRMLHIAGWGWNGLVGYSPIGLAREDIAGNLAARRYAAELFANHAAQQGHYTSPGKLSDGAVKRLQGSIDRATTQHGQRHRSLFLEEGTTFAGNSMNPQDVQMLEVRRFGVEDVARIYRIPPPLLQDLTNGTFKNVTELGRQFIVYTMMPWFRRWVAELNRKLAAPGHFFAFNADAFLEGDHAAQAAFFKSMSDLGVFSVNEMRRRLNMNDIGEDGDMRYVQINRILIDRMDDWVTAMIEGKGGKNQPQIDNPPGQREEQSVQSPELDAQFELLTERIESMVAEQKAAPSRIDPLPPEQYANALADNIQPRLDALGDSLKQATVDRKSEQDRQQAYCLAALLDPMARIISAHRQALREAAQNPSGFLMAVDEFQDNRRDRFVEILRRPLDSYLHASGFPPSEDLSAEFADRCLRTIKADILTASECKADELAASVTDCVAGWADGVSMITEIVGSLGRQEDGNADNADEPVPSEN